MASNLSCLGFDVATRAELESLVLGLADAAAFGLSCDAGDYRIWRSRTGAEIWFHLAKPMEPGSPREIVGLTPFFEGRSVIRVMLCGRFQRQGDTAFEGAYEAIVRDTSEPAAGNGSVPPAEVDPEALDLYPMIFDCVDFAAHSDHGLPAEADVRLTGFAREVVAFPDDSSYDAAHGEKGPPFAPKSFFPIGIFASASGEDDAPALPSAHAMFTGRIIEAVELVNERTRRPYHWLLIESLSATFDVVADPESVTGTLTPGATVKVTAWMFGRVLPSATPAA